MDRNIFEIAFLDRFFPHNMRKAKVEVFMNLKQYSMSVKKYSLKFPKLSMYALEMMVDLRFCMSKFIPGVSKLLIKKYRIAMLIGYMYVVG